LRPATLKPWRWIVAVTALALYCGVSLHLTGTLTPWAKHAAPTPALAAVRKNLSQLASRTNVAAAHGEDLAAAIKFYDAYSGPLLCVTESGI